MSNELDELFIKQDPRIPGNEKIFLAKNGYLFIIAVIIVCGNYLYKWLQKLELFYY